MNLAGVISGKALYEKPLHRRGGAGAPEGALACLLKRVIPCLDVDKGRVVKGTNFVDIRDAGDPVELAARYEAEGGDELVFLDITASHEQRDTIVELARRTAHDVFIPFTIGGGIRSVADAQAVLDAGADKVSVNSAAVQRPELIERAGGGVRRAVRGARDRRAQAGHGRRRLRGLHRGRPRRRRAATRWPGRARATERGAGEILLTSMDRDGTEDGYELDADARRGRRRGRAGDRLGRRRQARPTSSTPSSRAAPTPCCARRSSTTARTRSARRRSAMHAAGIPVRE